MLKLQINTFTFIFLLTLESWCLPGSGRSYMVTGSNYTENMLKRKVPTENDLVYLIHTLGLMITAKMVNI